MVTPFIPTEEELAERAAWKLRLQRPPSGQPQPPEPDSAPAPQATTPAPGPSADWTSYLRPVNAPVPDWTSYLRPVNAPVPDWYKPKPPAEKPKPPPAPGGGETSTSSAPEWEQSEPADGETSPISPISPGGRTREHPIPEDSILADYRDFVRQVSELPDGLIVAPILALCGRLLTPHVTLDFACTKPLTIYNFITTPAGLRKGTTFAPAEKIARQILMSDDLLYGNASDSALFDSFEQQPHRLQFEDEGNTLLRTWETSAHGKEVSARYLKLYDGAPWTQNYLRERKLHEGGSSERHIPQATLSLCIGATFEPMPLSNVDDLI